MLVLKGAGDAQCGQEVGGTVGTGQCRVAHRTGEDERLRVRPDQIRENVLSSSVSVPCVTTTPAAPAATAFEAASTTSRILAAVRLALGIFSMSWISTGWPSSDSADSPGMAAVRSSPVSRWLPAIEIVPPNVNNATLTAYLLSIGPRPDVHPLALRAEEAEHLRRPVAGLPNQCGTRVSNSGDLAGLQDEVVARRAAAGAARRARTATRSPRAPAASVRRPAPAAWISCTPGSPRAPRQRQIVIPLRLTGSAWTRGSPVGGASTSSSSGTPCARASGSSSSSVGRR